MLWPTNDDVVPFLKGNKRYYAVIKGNRIGNQELLVVFFFVRDVQYQSRSLISGKTAVVLLR